MAGCLLLADNPMMPRASKSVITGPPKEPLNSPMAKRQGWPASVAWPGPSRNCSEPSAPWPWSKSRFAVEGLGTATLKIWSRFFGEGSKCCPEVSVACDAMLEVQAQSLGAISGLLDKRGVVDLGLVHERTVMPEIAVP